MKNMCTAAYVTRSALNHAIELKDIRLAEKIGMKLMLGTYYRYQ
jgi:hypothetical protein